MTEVKFDTIGHDVLLKIQKQLRRNESKLFDQEIKSKYAFIIQDWIESEYPLLKEECNDIYYNVSRRMKNVIRKHDFEASTLRLERDFSNFLNHECQLSLPNEENKSKNLGLTKKEFKALLLQLQKGDETLIEKVYLAQFKNCLTNLIRAHNCSYEDAYESSIDALYEIRKDLIKNRIMYGNLGSYYNRRASLVLFKKKKKTKIETISLDSQLEFYQENLHSEILDDDTADMVKVAMSKLGEECEKIIKQFYFEETKLEEVATQLNKSHAAVRKQISRCRDKLRSYLSKELYNLT